MSMLGTYASWQKDTGYAFWSGDPQKEFVGIFERINIQPKGVIHVGLYDFIEYGCYTKLFGQNVIGVEANPDIYEHMAKPVGDKWGFKILNEFTYKEDNVEKDFWICPHGLGSSFYPGKPEWGKVHSIKVKTKTLATIIEENEVDMNNFDFLNIDVEGAELDVLMGFEKYLDYINVVDLETTFDDRHGADAPHQKIADWLTERGFVLTEMSPEYQREGQGDSLFVRKDREHTPFKDGNAGDAIFGKGYLEENWDVFPWSKWK